jgi:hypothetical protein
MSDTNTNSPHSAEHHDNAEDLAKYGIIRKPVDFFHVGGYRYSNLRDAIAQAKRMAAAA